MTTFPLAAGLAAVVAAALTVPVARGLGAPRWIAFVFLAALCGVLAATLSPVPLTYPPEYYRYRTCDVSSFAPPTLEQLGTVNDTSLNVALFVPLGLSCALLPRWPQVVLSTVVGALLAPAAETVQYLLPRLGRVCDTNDVAANLTGLAVGLLAGLLVARLIRTVPSPVGRRGPDR
jgi:hypothetical protein